MALLSDLRTGIATNLATIPGLRTASYIPDNPNPPFAIVAPSSIDYHQTYHNGLSTYRFTVTLVVDRASERTAQTKLDAYCSPTGTASVMVAVESDKTLGGKAFDVVVSGMRNYGSISLGDQNYLAAEFDLVVQAD